MKKEKSLQFYKKLMPEQLTLEIHKTDEGLWAKVKELPHCYTQGKTLFELVEMVNDAIYTYLDIPRKFRKKAGYYLPKEICDEIKRKEWEGTLRQMKKLYEKKSLAKEEKTLQKCVC
jgi:predicted RNase H-like HicB family nuclease